MRKAESGSEIWKRDRYRNLYIKEEGYIYQTLRKWERNLEEGQSDTTKVGAKLGNGIETEILYKGEG